MPLLSYGSYDPGTTSVTMNGNTKFDLWNWYSDPGTSAGYDEWKLAYCKKHNHKPADKNYIPVSYCYQCDHNHLTYTTTGCGNNTSSVQFQYNNLTASPYQPTNAINFQNADNFHGESYVPTVTYPTWGDDSSNVVVSQIVYLDAAYGSNYQTFWYHQNEVMETPEERARREALDLFQREKHESARRRAEELLLVCLNGEQRKQYIELGYFETTVNDKTYRINKGRSGNVHLIEKGVATARFCIHERECLPEGDTMLAQLMLLRNDEAEFLRTANRTLIHP